MKITNIVWDVEDEDIYGRCESCKNFSRCSVCSNCDEGSEYEVNNDSFNLPVEVSVPEEVDDEDVADYLSDKYGFCIKSYDVE